MGARRKGREIALQTLYLSDISKTERSILFQGLIQKQELDEKTINFTRELVEGTVEHKDELDKVIVKFSQNWEMNRMAALDRNILRLGAFELLYKLDTPVSVIIDEAVEIAKTFSTQDSGKFVNGILDKVKSQRVASKNGKERKSVSKKRN